MTMVVAGHTSGNDAVEVRVTKDGVLQVSGGTTATHVGSSALEKSHVVATDACVLRSAKVTNSGVVDAWLHIFDLDALPANGTAPDRMPVLVPAGLPNGDTWQGGTALSNGCVLALSTTRDTLTLVGSNVARFDAEAEL